MKVFCAYCGETVFFEDAAAGPAHANAHGDVIASTDLHGRFIGAPLPVIAPVHTPTPLIAINESLDVGLLSLDAVTLAFRQVIAEAVR